MIIFEIAGLFYLFAGCSICTIVIYVLDNETDHERQKGIKLCYNSVTLAALLITFVFVFLWPLFILLPRRRRLP